jgi:pimeloyl-ACP methyl ester carboxylesterase
VFLHGSWQDGEQWQVALETLREDFHCLAPDLLGFGASERPKLRYSIALEVECLAEWLRSLRLETVYLVGHSLGAWVAATYALRFPQQVQKLVLMDPEGVRDAKIPRADGLDLWLAPRHSLFADLLQSLRPLAKLLGQKATLERLLQRRSQLRNFPIACQLLFLRRSRAIEAELLQTHAGPSQLGQIMCPTLVLQSVQASERVQAISQIYARQIRLSTLKVLGGEAQHQSPQLLDTLKTFLI